MRLWEDETRSTMSSTPLHTTYSLTGPVALIAFEGEIDVATAPRVAAQLYALIEAGAREVLVDLSATRFLDSAGIGVLVDAAYRAHESGGRLYVFRAAEQPRRAIKLARMPRKISLV